MSSTDPASTPCLLGDPEQPHAASVGYVCEGHRAAVYDNLRAIVDTVARIVIRSAQAGAPNGGRPGTLKSQRFLLDVESVALAGPLAPGEITTADGWDEHHPLAVVAGWARMIREERKISAPDTPLALSTEVDLLVRQLDWCCAQPWIDDMVTEINASLGRVRRADPDRFRPSNEGHCPKVRVTGETCGGQLRRDRGAVPWVIRGDRCERVAVDVHGGPIRCQECGATWVTARDEATLRTMCADVARDALRPRDRDGRPMVTARELADRADTTVAAIRKQLQRAGIKPVGGQWYQSDATPGQMPRDMVS